MRSQEQLGKSWAEIERELFADVIEFHRLVEFEGYDNEADLLATLQRGPVPGRALRRHLDDGLGHRGFQNDFALRQIGPADAYHHATIRRKLCFSL